MADIKDPKQQAAEEFDRKVSQSADSAGDLADNFERARTSFDDLHNVMKDAVPDLQKITRSALSLPDAIQESAKAAGEFGDKFYDVVESSKEFDKSIIDIAPKLKDLSKIPACRNFPLPLQM